MTTNARQKPKRGRPRDAEVPARIEAAARTLFRENGFGDTSVRAIAEAAGSSAALIIRHFGSKEQLFLRAMSLDGRLGDVIDGPAEQLARTILSRLLVSPDRGLPELWRAFMLAGDQREIQRYRRELAQRYLFDALMERLDGESAEARAHLITAQIMGLVLLLWVDEHPALIALPPADLIDLYAPSLQRLIDSVDAPGTTAGSTLGMM